MDPVIDPSEAKDALEVENGQYQILLRHDAWHRFAIRTPDGEPVGWDEAVRLNLTITRQVEKVAMRDLIPFYPVGDDEYAALRAAGSDPDKHPATVLKTGLGTQWTPFQAADAYAFGQCIREQGAAQGIEITDLESLGTLRDGRQWFMTFSAGDFTIGDYVIKDHLSLSGSWDSSLLFQVDSGGTVYVCANTVAFGRKHGITHFSFKHTSGINNRVEEAKRALVTHRQNSRTFKEVAETLLATPVSPAQYNRLVQALFPLADDTPTRTRNVNEAAIESVSALYKAQGGPNVVSEPGNGWAVVQAVNTYENWGAPVRKTGDASEADVRALRQIDAVTGNGQVLTSKAAELVLAL